MSKRTTTLTFRDMGDPHSVRRRLIFLVILYIVSLAVFSAALNYKPKDETMGLPAGTLPVISVEAEGNKL